MSNLEEKLEREFQEKCKKRAAYESAKELSDLRDHFAGLAMSGCFAAFKHYPYEGEVDRVAEIAYKAADAMLKQRSL